MTDPKDQWIARLVKGKSFIDIGGLWGTLNEKVTLAVQNGASSATMADIAPLDHQLWQDFDDHSRAKGVTNYSRVNLDVTAPYPERTIEPKDIVHCSGIIYHVPDPFGMLANLRRVTNEYLILTSMVVPSRVSNEAGDLVLHHDTIHYVPTLREEIRKVVAAHFDARNVKIDAINRPLSEPWLWSDGKPNFGPWWWIWSPDFLRSLLQTAGFDVEEECWSWSDMSYSFLAKRREITGA